MDVTIYHPSETSDWAGGTTTELFIYPEGADYTSRNFHFRLSTATVEVEESTFTPLAGVSRVLMVLQGKIELKHEDQHTKTLEKFDIDQFEGDWITSSKGQCVDFNLMLRRGTKGTVEGIAMKKNSTYYLRVDGKLNFMYLLSGVIELDGRAVFPGSLVRMKLPSEGELFAREDSDLILVEIQL